MASTEFRVAVVGAVGLVLAAGVTGYFTLLDNGDATPPVPRVASVSLSAPTTDFYSACPLTLRFDGKIDIAGGEGVVVYRFLFVDSFNGPTVAAERQQVSVSGPGTTEVMSEWTPNIPVGDVFRTATLEVLEPRQVRSDPVTIRGRCDATLPTGPDVPPPDVPGGPPG